MNKKWMALFLSAGIAATACPVPGAQEPPAELVHREQSEESSAQAQKEESEDKEAADEFQTETESSESETETSESESETVASESNEANGTGLDMQTVASYIQEAAAAEELDLSSDRITNFFLASDAYDSLTEEEKKSCLLKSQKHLKQYETVLQYRSHLLME